MKRILYALLPAVALLMAACDKYDDSELRGEMNDIRSRVENLEALCSKINGNVSSIQTLLENINAKVAIDRVLTLENNEGYLITFSNGSSITVYNGLDGKDGKDGTNGKDGVNGKDGADGKDGVDGKDGKDGVDGKDGKDGNDGKDGKDAEAPVIGVKAEESVLYWTLNGDWLLDAEGNKIPVVGEKGDKGDPGDPGLPGEDGEDGEDGVTPQLKIENGAWMVSTDNGKTWSKVETDGSSTAPVAITITETEDGTAYDITVNDQTYTVAKAGAFLIKVDQDDLVFSGGSVTVTYTLTGDDETTHVVAEAVGVKAELDTAAKTLTISSSGQDAPCGYVILRAIRNSDGAYSAQYIGVEGPVLEFTEVGGEFNVEGKGGTIEVKVKTNIEYTVKEEQLPEWISKVDTKAVREETISFSVAANTTSEPRSATFTIVGADNGPELTVIVNQEKGETTPSGGDSDDVLAVTLSEFLAAAESDSQVYELVGVIGGSINTTYGNFDLTDDSGTVYVYGLTATELGYGAKNDKSFASLDLNKGDTIKLRGYRGSFNGKDEVTYAWFIEKIASGDSGQGGDTPGGDTGDVKAVTVSEFLAAAESETQVYELVGVIGGSINTTYGNFDLTDDSGTVYVYGLTATELGYGEKNDKSFASLDLNQGDTIKLRGYRGSFNGKDEVMYAWFIEKIASGDSGQGGDTPGGGEVTGDFASNVEWSLDSSAYSQDATVNGTEGVSVLKLGTAKVSGSATLTLPSASTKLSFYAISWNNATVANLVFKVNGKEVKTVTPASNSGLAGNPTYTLTVTDSDYYTIDLGSAVTTVTVETSGGFRAALFGIQAK